MIKDDILRNEPSAGRDFDFAADSNNRGNLVLFSQKKGLSLGYRGNAALRSAVTSQAALAMPSYVSLLKPTVSQIYQNRHLALQTTQLALP